MFSTLFLTQRLNWSFLPVEGPSRQVVYGASKRGRGMGKLFGRKQQVPA